MRLLCKALDVFHLIWILLLISGPFIAMKVEWYKTVSSIILQTTIISQIIFISCPIVLVQGLIKRHYLNEDVVIPSFTNYLFKLTFGIDISPAAVTIIVFSVLVIVFWLNASLK